MDLYTEISHGSLIKREQELCGDKVELYQNQEETLLVLSDGLGSGVKANILATLTSRIIMTMLQGGASIDEVVETLVKTLPVCKERRVAYSTFTILRVKKNGLAHLVEYDNPDAIIIRNGEELMFHKEENILHGKAIKESTLHLLPGDIFIAMSDGVICAGPNQFLTFAWKRENLVSFAVSAWEYDESAFAMKKRLLEECNRRYLGEIGDDSTIAVCKVQHESQVHIMVGPPLDPNDDEKIVARFMDTYGKKIICGGKTSRIVSTMIDKEIKLLKKDKKIDIPPMAWIDGIDLVTEGILTISKALEIMNALDFLSISEFERMKYSESGAERLVWMLMEGGTHLTFFMGRANNVAHDHNKGIEFGQKERLVKALAKELKCQHKFVEIEYC